MLLPFCSFAPRVSAGSAPFPATQGVLLHVVTALRARKLDSAAQTAARATTYPAATVKTSGGPNPAFAANTCAPARATAVGPKPAPSATFRKKLIDIASPRERFG